MTVNITDFRKNLFKYADFVKNGYEVEVEKDGVRVFTVSKPKDSEAIRAKKLAQALKNAAGKFPDWNIDIDKIRHNKAEREYMNRYKEWHEGK